MTQSMTGQTRAKIDVKPFLRWAGSKRLLLKHIVPNVPKSYGTYFEPFLGSGALFLSLQPKKAVLNDKAFEVINLFRALLQDVDRLLTYTEGWEADQSTYYRIRANRSSDPIKRAAEFLYLNKTCWNGLFRVNASGDFNVPYGNNKVTEIVDSKNLRRCGQLLSEIKPDLINGDFEIALSACRAGDFVYLDPPYVTGHNNNGFLSYNEKIFAWSDQVRLSKVAIKLANKGVHVIVSNANHPDVVALYQDFTNVIVERNSTISGASTARGPITEVLLLSETKRNGARER